MNKCNNCHHDVVNYRGLQYTYNSPKFPEKYFIGVTCDYCESYLHLTKDMYVKKINHAQVRDDLIDLQDKLKRSELEELTMKLAELM